MAQAGYTPIQLYFSTTAAAVPLAANLAQGELAINIADGKLYFENSSGVVTLLASSTTVTNSFSAGTTGFTPSTATTGAVTLGGTLITSNGGTGLSSYTAGDLTYYATGTTFTKLAIGTAGQFLTSSGTAPQWSTLSGVAVTTFQTSLGGLTPSTATSGAVTLAGTLNTSSGGTGLSSYTAGDLPYYAAGTLLSKLAIGAANRVLTSTGSAPQWVASLTGLTSVSATTFTENGYAVVSQADIGTADNEIPLNQYLGSMAYQNGTDYYNVGMTVGYRNRLFNGAMQIDQRNAGAAVTVNTVGVFCTDRWANIARPTGGGVYSAQQVSDAPTGFSNSLKLTVTTADTSLGASDYYFSWQKIEGFNTVNLLFGTASAKTVTLSFWVKSSITGQFSAFLMNQAESYSQPFAYTINAANTWEFKTITFAGAPAGTWIGATNNTGLIVGFGLASGTSLVGPSGAWAAAGYYGSIGDVNWMATNGNTFQYTGVQLEVGTQATPFDWRPYGTELALCQRYYLPISLPVDSASTFPAVIYGSATYLNLVLPVTASMRTNPTVIPFIGTSGPTYTKYDGSGTSTQAIIGLTASTRASNGVYCLEVFYQGAGSWGTGSNTGSVSFSAGTACQLNLSAEL